MTRKKRSRISLFVPEGVIAQIDLLVGLGEEYTSRSEFIRAGVEMLLILEIIRDEKLVYVSEDIVKEALKAARLGK